MYFKKTLISLAISFLTFPVLSATEADNYSLSLGQIYSTDSPAPQRPDHWYTEGERTFDKNRQIARDADRNLTKRAKNIILFVGDGMGISTLTAARIYEGQLNGKDGEENELFFERFPHLALSKTYNVNQQTPDSAGTMTAMMTGIKTDAGVISVNQNVTRGDCDSQTDTELFTALELAEIVGMSTGVVSTARITHATPAATYAHIMDRNFEDDRDAANLANPGSCKDIASQLIDFPERFRKQFPLVDGLEVVMGGGRRSFLPRIDNIDPEDGLRGERLDGRNLVQDWQARYPNAYYIWNQQQFDAIDPYSVDHLLGLFEMSHMEYEYDRPADTGGEPSLSEMTGKAIQILSKNDKGFFLHVESGRIDHAHHATNPFRALEDTIEFAHAVRVAYESTDPEETLIIVTADHSHVFTIAGYPTRGNPILGKVIGNDSAGDPMSDVELAEDGIPYTTLGYTNGRGFQFFPGSTTADMIYDVPVNFAGRADLAMIDTSAPGFHPEVTVPLESETHAAEDVAIYATGPGAALINGLMEQNAIFHVMVESAALTKRARSEGWTRPRANNTK